MLQGQPGRTFSQACLRMTTSVSRRNGTFVGKAQVLSALGQSSAVRYGSPKIFIFGSDVAVTVAVGSEGNNGGPDPWIAARVFQKRSESWRVIAEDIRPAVTPVPEPGTRPTTQPAALPPRGIEDTEVRRAVEAWRADSALTIPAAYDASVMSVYSSCKLP